MKKDKTEKCGSHDRVFYFLFSDIGFFGVEKFFSTLIVNSR